MWSIFVSICDLKDLIDLQIFNKKRYKKKKTNFLYIVSFFVSFFKGLSMVTFAPTNKNY